MRGGAGVSPNVLILRARPAADITAERVRAAGFLPLVHPLFELRATAWSSPAETATALLITSANAVRLAGPLPETLAFLPVFAVGPATAAAARACGQTVAFTGTTDGAEAVRALSEAGHRTVAHLRGKTARPLPPLVRILPVITYIADPSSEPLPQLPTGTIALLHSPRTAAVFADRLATSSRVRTDLSIVAISDATADTAGPGWRRVEVAKRPTDGAMVEAAARLAADPA